MIGIDPDNRQSLKKTTSLFSLRHDFTPLKIVNADRRRYNRQRFAPLRAVKSTDCPTFPIPEEAVKDNLE